MLQTALISPTPKIDRPRVCSLIHPKFEASLMETTNFHDSNLYNFVDGRSIDFRHVFWISFSIHPINLIEYIFFLLSWNERYRFLFFFFAWIGFGAMEYHLGFWWITSFDVFIYWIHWVQALTVHLCSFFGQWNALLWTTPIYGLTFHSVLYQRDLSKRKECYCRESWIVRS